MVSQFLIRGKPIAESDLKSLQERVAGVLPVDYVAFLSEGDGGRVRRPNSLANHQPDYWPLDVREIFSYADVPEASYQSLGTWMDRTSSWLPSNLLPVAMDEGGNLYLLVVSGDPLGAVLYHDHETEIEDGLRTVADTFRDFVSQITPIVD